MFDVIIKRQFLYKRLPALFILTGEACLKNPLFCNFAFLGIKNPYGYLQKLNNDSLFLLKIKTNL